VAEALALTVRAFSRNPGLTLWVATFTVTLVLVTDTHSRLYKWIGGLTHAVVHWACLFVLGWGVLLLVNALPPPLDVGRFTLMALLVGVGAWVLGSCIVGLYLLVSLNVFGRHSEEAFSSLRIEDYKHFLRLHIARDGSLTIYPIAIDRVPRRWTPRPDSAQTPSALVPDEPFDPSLIEPPIVVAGVPSPEAHGNT
jgi:hypothetical protein